MTTARPFRSGFCASGNHHRCRGGHDANPTHTWIPCTCTCHEETPMPDALTPEDLDRLPTIDVSHTDQIHVGPLPEDADGWLDLLSAATDGLDGAVGSQPLADLTWEQQIALLDRLRTVTARLGQLDALLVRSIYLHGEHGKQVLDGIGEVWVTRTRSKERWDERGVAQAVIDAKMGERGGEMPDEPWDVAEWLLEVLSVGYVRKGALDALGIDRDPFYDSEPGKPQVTLPPRD